MSNASQDALAPVGQTCVYNRADGFGYVTPTRECGHNRTRAQEFQMRNKTFISSMVGIAAAVAVAGSANAAVVPVYNFALTFNTPNPTPTSSSKMSNGNASGLWDAYVAVVNSTGSDIIASPGSMQFAVGSAGDSSFELSSNAGVNLLGVTDFQFNVTAYTGVATNWEFYATDINGRILSSAQTPTSGIGLKTFAVSSFTQFSGSGFDWSKVTAITFNVYGTGSATSFTFDSWTAVGVVPAPGALALLGAAGLVGARRRRA